MTETNGKEAVGILDSETGEYVSKNELKKRIKARQKAAEKLEKASNAADQGSDQKVDQVEKEDPRLYFENRSKFVQGLRAQGKAYPHKFSVDMSLQKFIDKYSGLGDGERAQEIVHVAGRLHNIRSSSKNLVFYDLHGEGIKIQIMAAAQGMFL
jgi:lysyl-tRNA synthetase class 2